MINQKEYEVLKGLDDKWKWIARDFGDHGGSLFAYLEKPYKRDVGMWHYGRGVHHIDNRLFQFIQWGDEEPYSITELMEEYEKEREETEIKDINPLMKYVNREIETMKDILSHMDREESEEGNEWLEGFLSALEKVRDKLNKLDEPEVLSQELPVIPQWTADRIEEVKASGDSLDDAYALLRGIYRQSEVADWMAENKKNSELFARAWLGGFKVKKEQRYYLKIGNLYLAEPLGDMTSDIVRMTRDKGVAYQFTDEKSIATHLDKFEGAEAVKVEEVE